MSTLPKSVQALQGSGDSQSNSNNIRAKRQACKDLIDQYRALPDDFLRLPSNYYAASNQAHGDPATLDLAAHQATGLAGPEATSTSCQMVDMIDISVVGAQLVKNYGLLRMDLYCKIRVGHMVCETQTCPNGAKNPKWDGVYQFNLKPGINSFHLEIYDEKQFSLDEKIAWLHEPIPQEIFRGITVERWFPLTGRSGPNKEGSVLLVVSHKRVPMRSSNLSRSIISQHRQQMPYGTGPILVPGASPHHMIGGPPTVVPVDPNSIHAYLPNPPVSQPEHPQHLPTDTHATVQTREPAAEIRPASTGDINQLSEMFPSIDKQIIKAILENNNHDKEASIVALLAMG